MGQPPPNRLSQAEKSSLGWILDKLALLRREKGSRKPAKSKFTQIHANSRIFIRLFHFFHSIFIRLSHFFTLPFLHRTQPQNQNSRKFTRIHAKSFVCYTFSRIFIRLSHFFTLPFLHPRLDEALQESLEP